MNRLVVFHGGCRDGFCAAWVVWRRYPEAEFVPGYYGQNPPDVKDKQVTIVDFCYPRDVLEKMAESADSLLILDHHKTAQEALDGFVHPRAMVHFDMDKSGAGLAWDFYFPGKPRSFLVDYVEDRDLWRNSLPESSVINAFISTLKFDFETWNKVHKDSEESEWDGDRLIRARPLGEGALLKTQQYVREVAKNARMVTFEGYEVPLVNAPQIDISELLDSMVQDHPFAMGWWQRADGIYQYSFRSRGGLDVSDLAKKYGGGGHQNAAGFQRSTPLDLPSVT